MVVFLEQGADLHMAQLMPLPLTASCFSKIQVGFTFLVPAHPGFPEKKPLNGCALLSSCNWSAWRCVQHVFARSLAVHRRQLFTDLLRARSPAFPNLRRTILRVSRATLHIRARRGLFYSSPCSYARVC